MLKIEMPMRAMAVAWLFWMAVGSAVGAEKPARLPVEILEPVVVQDFGFEKTLLTFAQERLDLIGRAAHLPGQHPIATVLEMIANPRQWQDKPLFKVEHPDLVRLFDRRKYISASDFMSDSTLEQLRSLIQSKPSVRDAINDLNERVEALLDLESQLALVPRRTGEWVAPTTLGRDAGDPTDRAFAKSYMALKAAVLERNPETFATAARELATLNQAAAREAGVASWRVRADILNTRLRAFHWSAALYLLAALGYVGALLFRGGRRAATAASGLMILGLLAQVAGLALRTLLVRRAPLSNMYESLVFAVGGMVLFAAILDRMYRNTLAGLAGSLLGFVFLVIAVKMPIHQSRLNQLMPALQSSWLTYHVTTVMLSYSAFALSFFVSIVYLAKEAVGGDGTRGRLLQALPSLDALDFFNYRIVAVGFPLLTLGIFTGAVWAATAWGRPWAFDPKETWSAITWLVYGVYLHTRLMGGWKGRRSAILAIVGFAAVLFTYVGVNYLLPGLHSYAK